MTDDYNDLNIDDDNEEEEGGAAPSQSNRTFLLAAGIVGGLFLFGVIVLGLLVFLILPGQRTARVQATETAAALYAAQTEESNAATVVAKAPTVAINTSTPTETALPTNTPTETPTPVVAEASTTPNEDEALAAANTATVAALLTQVAGGQEATPTDITTEVVSQPTEEVEATATPEAIAQVTATSTSAAAVIVPTNTPAVAATALPTTGFADEVGIPGLFGIAVVLMVVIFAVRRLRTA